MASSRVLGVILARAGSTRLPRKMLCRLGETTVLGSVIQRARNCRRIDSLVLATSTSPEDDEIVALAESFGLEVVRGAEEDVVERLCMAVSQVSSDVRAVVRINADNPLMMPSVVDEAVDLLFDRSVDLVTPFELATYPFGYGMVVMTRECLARIDEEAEHPIYREHVENYCLERPDDFRVHYQVAPEELSYPELCLSLDYPVDLMRIRQWEATLRRVPLADQPRVLLDRVRKRTCQVVSLPENSDDFPVVVVRDRPAPAVPRAIFRVGIFGEGNHRRYCLRHDESSGPDFPRGPVFVETSDTIRRESAVEFLERILPQVEPLLRTSPVRELSVQESWAPPPEKSVSPSHRQSALEAVSSRFPREVVFATGNLPAGGPEHWRRLFDELECSPFGSLVFPKEQTDESWLLCRDEACQRFGSERLQESVDGGLMGDSEENLGRLEVVSNGTMRTTLDPVGVAIDRVSISEYWRSPTLLRARVEFLNRGEDR